MIPREDKNYIGYKILQIKLARVTCHLINKAVMKQNCIEALNQPTRSTAGKERCPLEFHLKLRQFVDQNMAKPLRNETAEQLLHHNWQKYYCYYYYY